MSNKKNHPLFVVDATDTVKWPVIVNIPVDGGEFAPFQFTGIFKRKSESEYESILQSTLAEIGPADEAAAELLAGKRRSEILADNADLFLQLLVGWEDVRNAAGGPVEFSAQVLLDQITGVNGGYLSIGLWAAIHEIRNGARLGN